MRPRHVLMLGALVLIGIGLLRSGAGAAYFLLPGFGLFLIGYGLDRRAYERRYDFYEAAVDDARADAYEARTEAAAANWLIDRERGAS